MERWVEKTCQNLHDIVSIIQNDKDFITMKISNIQCIFWNVRDYGIFEIMESSRLWSVRDYGMFETMESSRL